MPYVDQKEAYSISRFQVQMDKNEMEWLSLQVLLIDLRENPIF